MRGHSFIARRASCAFCLQRSSGKGATECAQTINLTYSSLLQTAGVETEYVQSDTEYHGAIWREINRIPIAILLVLLLCRVPFQEEKSSGFFSGFFSLQDRHYFIDLLIAVA